jgi:hypothetical protein
MDRDRLSRWLLHVQALNQEKRFRRRSPRTLPDVVSSFLKCLNRLTLQAQCLRLTQSASFT